MELKQLEYITTIAQEASISKAAEKLFITQSALNQQLLRLERELGLNLFNRIRHSMIPTYAGKIYLTAAQQILDTKKETYKILHDISNIKRGEISITYTPERGAVMFSEVYPIFHKLYPEISFKVYEARIKKMEQLLLQGDVSLAFLSHTEKNPLFDYYELTPELLILALPASHPLAHLGGSESYNTFPPLDLALLKDDPFVLMSQETRFRDMIDAAFAKAGFKPHILFESTSTYTVFNMVKNQICPAFFPQSYVDPSAPIVYFSLNPSVYWMRSIACRKGAYLNKAEQDLIKLVRGYMGK